MPSTAPPTTGSSGGASTSADQPPAPAADFSCCICFDTAVDPVTTKCGHLYCWPCLERWLQREPECPMCKGHIARGTPGDIIPLYGKGGKAGHSFHAPSQEGTGVHPSAGPQVQPERDARPQGNREQPQLRPANRFNFQQHGGWGGGMLFFFTSPSLITWQVMLLLILAAVMYKFVPWRQWLGMEAPAGEADHGAAPERPRQEARPREYMNIAILIALFSIFVWMAGV